MFATLGGIFLGLLLGLRHAFEPDHLTAVSTLVVETRDARRSALLGAIWGLGHTLALVVVGTIVLATGAALSERAGAMFELGVAAMLVVLGVRSLLVAARQEGSEHRHRHGQREHVHAAPAEHVHIGARTLAWRPLVVGLIHGLAGSGALTALVFAELPTTATRFVYMVLFGLGSVAGMAIASGLAGASLLRITSRRQRLVAFASGALSILLGFVWALPPIAAL